MARGTTIWNEEFHRAGVYWKDPWNLEYYVDGKLVRTVSGKDMIDPKGFTNGSGLKKAMHIIINTEDQDWRSNAGDFASDEELADYETSTMFVDWVRAYQAVEVSE